MGRPYKPLGIAAKAAKERGESKFLAPTGVGCQLHDGWHYSANSLCCKCQTEKRLVNDKAYRVKNKVLLKPIAFLRTDEKDLERLSKIKQMTDFTAWVKSKIDELE